MYVCCISQKLLHIVGLLSDCTCIHVHRYFCILLFVSGRVFRSRRLPLTVFDPFQDYSRSKLLWMQCYITFYVME